MILIVKAQIGETGPVRSLVTILEKEGGKS
jgi:hypothetical protein